MAKQNQKSELSEAEDLIRYAQQEGAKEEMIGKVIFVVMGVGFAVLIVLKLMGKI